MPIAKRLKNAVCATALLCKLAVCGSAQPQEKTACGPLSNREDVLTCCLEEARILLKNKETGTAVKLLRDIGRYTADRPLQEAHRLSLLGRAYSAETGFDSSYRYREAAARLYLEQKQYDSASAAHRELGILFIQKNDLNAAAPYLFKALEFAERAGLDSLKMGPSLNLYYIFSKLGEHKKAREYQYKTYRLAKKYRNKTLAAISGVDIAMDYIEASMLDSARQFVQQMLPDTQGSQSIKACAYYTWALWEITQGNWKAAHRHYENMNTDPVIQSFYRVFFSNAYANYLTQRKLYKEARPIFEDALTVARSNHHSDLLVSLTADYQKMLENAGDYRRAYEVLKENSAVRDSIYNFEKQEAIRELNIKYETAEKERQLQASRIELAEHTNQRNLLFGCFLLAGLIGTFVVLRQRYRIQAANKLREQESELTKQKMESLRREQNYVAFRSMVAGEETERNRLAKELHDGLGGMLSNLKLTLTNRYAGNGEGNLQATVKLVDSASTELRRIAQNMMPEALAKFGLIPALEDLCADLESHTKLQTSFQHYGIREPLPESMTLPLYRIVQESLNNVVKHAGATEAMVQLVGDESALHLTIEDNGNGFLLEHALENGGSGLKNLQSRVAFLNGNIEFDSAPGEGTAVNIDIPIPKEI